MGTKKVKSHKVKSHKVKSHKVKSHKVKKTKKVSPYNKFMKLEIPKLKKSNPKMDHKAAFKQAAKNWSLHKKK